MATYPKWVYTEIWIWRQTFR